MNFKKIIIPLFIVAVIIFLYNLNSQSGNTTIKPDTNIILKGFTPQQSPTFKVKVANPNEDIKDKITVYNPKGQEIDALIDVEGAGSERNITFSHTNSFSPGKYKFVINLGSGQKIEQDFTWGVLAINPNKSVYAPNETAKLALAVLDEKGKMVCDAKVKLVITNPQGQITELTTENGLIKVNPECYIKDFTLNPDYETSYKTQTAGTYKINLIAETNKGAYSIADFFLVKESVPFSVERQTATRIYPPKAYPVLLTVIASQDFDGVISERLPISFQAIPSNIDKSYDKEEVLNEERILYWRISLQKGQRINLTYNFKAPDISPQFYLLGPLAFLSSSNQEIYTEERQWQIAADAIAFVQEVASGGTTVSTGTTLDITVTVTTTVGNHLILSAVAGNARVISSVADTKGNTWQVDKTQAATDAGTSIASAKITTALVNTDTITITFSGTGAFAASAQEYSGLDSTAWFDVGSGNGGLLGTASDSLATATTAQADELLYGATGHVSTVTSFTPETQSPVWNQRTVAASSVSTVRTIRPMDRIVSSTGTYAAKATWTTSRNWGAVIATYKAAAAPTPTPTPGSGNFRFDGLKMQGIQIN